MGSVLGGGSQPQGNSNNNNNIAVPAGPGAAALMQQAGLSMPGMNAPQSPPPTAGSSLGGPAAAPSNPNSFLPPVFQDPFVNGIRAGQNVANFAGQALPNISGFMQALFSPNMTPMEASYAQAASNLGLRGLAQTQAGIMGQFEGSGMNSAMAPLLMNSANQYADQMNQMIGQMGTNRMGLAAQSMIPSMGFPLQALQTGQQSAEGLYGMANNAMYGDLQFPLAMFGSTPFSAPTVIAQPASSGGKGGK